MKLPTTYRQAGGALPLYHTMACFVLKPTLDRDPTPVPMTTNIVRCFSVALLCLFTAGHLAAGPRFDFGGADTADSYLSVDETTLYNQDAGFGWMPEALVATTDEERPDSLRRDFAWSADAAVFRVDLEPGVYRLTVTSGNRATTNHSTLVSVNADGIDFPRMYPLPGQYVTSSASIPVTEGFLEITLETERNRWVVNALALEREDDLVSEEIARTPLPAPEHWSRAAESPDPTAPLAAEFRAAISNRKPPDETGLNRNDYLDLLRCVVEAFRDYQEDSGAIIDPYADEETRYATPAYALAAAVAAKADGSASLIQLASDAMDHAVNGLANGQGSNQYEDFHVSLLARTLPFLQDTVEEERLDRWRTTLAGLEPSQVYRAPPGGGHWNVSALSGEARLQDLGLRENGAYVDRSLREHGRFFTPWGLYLDPGGESLAYDLFARFWLTDMLTHGYTGAFANKLNVLMDRGALTSLFLQSPHGTLPIGGRGSQHQWNEALQCAAFEIHARRAIEAGDPVLAGVFKRAARLSLASLRDWVRPEKDFWIVKNRYPPKERHGFEATSHHSSANLLTVALLALAHHHAAFTENQDVPVWREQLTPVETGGFLLDLREDFHTVIANAGGHYVLIDTAGLPNLHATGLLRVHHPAGDPLLGPGDGVAQRDESRLFAAAGLTWRDSDGQWRRLGEYDKRAIDTVDLTIDAQDPERIDFTLTYHGEFRGVEEVREHYVLEPEELRLTASASGGAPLLGMVWPVFETDGENSTAIDVGSEEIRVTRNGHTQIFHTPDAGEVRLGEQSYHTRHGLARLGVARFPADVPPTLVIRPETASGD